MQKTSPGLMAIIYIAMGILFTNLAIKSADETIWNAATLALAAIAALDFGVGIRFIRMFFKKKDKKE
ncbi:DUF4305 domain-containing protein [Virgibacillus sp. MSJ-26]|uniref:DUF4305 domain-containing protein n=1 Tax=Virgibacillus sp. MSJ-26 TaxID=2841522 RepID=UPI001C0F5228|nr:DUF4305 domain-containing protein [Virgibacillus sp. MSJ-26]MBU5466950.1 DUF4305 domain-containing protein [Virgibacillus sp. MSJ-26]